jgi:hypothetical protein
MWIWIRLKSQHGNGNRDGKDWEDQNHTWNGKLKSFFFFILSDSHTYREMQNDLSHFYFNPPPMPLKREKYIGKLMKICVNVEDS